MSIKKLAVLLFSIFISNTVLSQTLIHVPSQNYSDVDDFVMTLNGKKYASVDSIAAELSSFKKPHLKIRAIYRWVTNYVAFDCIGNKNPKKAIVKVDDVLLQQKATALGYANLVKALCDKMNIPCDVVAGYARTAYAKPGAILKTPNHFWNSVKIYNKWYIMDAAWGSGTIDKKGNVFSKKYNDNYFVANPRQYILNHLPVKSDKQYLDTLVDKSTFFNYPQVYDDFFEMGIYALTPNESVIKIVPGKKKNFSFKLLDSLIVDQIEIFDRKTKGKETVPFLQAGNYVTFSSDFKKLKKQLIDIYVNNRQVVTYRVIEKREEK